MIQFMKFKKLHRALLLSVLLLFAGLGVAQAKIDGLVGSDQGNTFYFTAKTDHISTGEGNSVLIWGYSDDGAHGDSWNVRAQYPGPTMILQLSPEGTVSIDVNLTNELVQPTSIVFPGADAVTAAGDTAGTLTWQADAATETTSGSATYTVTYSQPGTYTYYSGTNMDLQVEMGLVGAIVVRPADYNEVAPTAYGDGTDTAYNYETLFLLTDIDPVIHELVEFGRFDQIDMTERYATYWFINGRNGPDTLLDSFVSWLPTQPYNSLPRIRPCEELLLRLVGAGMDGHPFHTHGNNITVVGRDARLLSTDPATAGADLAYSDFTQSVYPGETYDAIFTWTGADMGWDYYGHAEGDPLTACEQEVIDAGKDASHGDPIPVELPGTNELTFSPFYSGSPYLGGSEFLPPGEGGFNQNGGFYYMWHSHNEKELTNWDIFPGGMLTFLIIEPPFVDDIQ